jgi:hypothetical protein
MAFSQRGGLLIADSHLAYFDENLHGRHVPAMDEFFSLSRDARPLNLAELGRKPEVAAEFGLTLGERGVEELGPSSRDTVILKKQGQGNGGCTLFLNLDLANYKRSDPRSGRLRDLLGKWFKENGVGSQPTIEVEGGAAAPRVLAYHFQGGGGERLVAMCLEDVKAPPVQVHVRFPAAIEVDELVSGRTLAAAAEHTIELRPESAVVIKFRPGEAP